MKRTTIKGFVQNFKSYLGVKNWVELERLGKEYKTHLRDEFKAGLEADKQQSIKDAVALFNYEQQQLSELRIKHEADIAEDMKEAQKLLASIAFEQVKSIEKSAQSALIEGLTPAIATIAYLENELEESLAKAPLIAAKREAKLILEIERLNHDVEVFKALRKEDRLSIAPRLEAFSTPTKGDFVYLISDGKYTKIGYSNNPYARLTALQTANPQELKIVALFPVASGKALEQLIHSQLESHKVSGEWFDAPLIQILGVVSLSLSSTLPSL